MSIKQGKKKNEIWWRNRDSFSHESNVLQLERRENAFGNSEHFQVICGILGFTLQALPSLQVLKETHIFTFKPV